MSGLLVISYYNEWRKKVESLHHSGPRLRAPAAWTMYLECQGQVPLAGGPLQAIVTFFFLVAAQERSQRNNVVMARRPLTWGCKTCPVGY